MATLGQRIKKLREGKGLSQGELGKLVNVGNTTISQWENDKRTPDLATLDKLANVLKTSSDYLLGRTDDPSPTNARQLPQTVAPYLPEGFEELPPEAKEEIFAIIDYVMTKYRKKEGDDKR